MKLEQQQTMKRKPVPDPHQHTVSGGVVHLIWRLISIILAVTLFVGIAGGVAAMRVYTKGMAYLKGDIEPNAHFNLDGVQLNQSAFILAKNKAGDYVELRQLFAAENRVWADFEEIPKDMINATVAIEDKRFWEHDGVDWMRTLGASANMFIGGSQFGGSTLTQQLIKNLSGERDVTVRRKLMEIFRAMDLEEKYTKEEIITWYLNTIYLGNYLGENAYGVKSAAKVYFGKELNQLTTKECACIIGITNNPSLYNPYYRPENNEERTQLILQQMFEQGYIPDRESFHQASEQKLEFKHGRDEDQKFTCPSCGHSDVIANYVAAGDFYACPVCGEKNHFAEETEDYYSYFEDQVIADVTQDLAELKGITLYAANQMVITGGFRIYSTIDLEAQAKVDEIYQDVENIPKTYPSKQFENGKPKQLQSAIVVVDNKTGDIVAMAGGVGKKEGSLTMNRAVSRRAPGSSLKPLTVYSPALELGLITPGSPYQDSPFMKLNGEDWPNNDGSKPNGEWMLAVNGLARSLNTVAVKVLDSVTPQKSFQFAKERFELNNLNESGDIGYAPLGLGQLTDGLSVREMANAYASFPNGGVFRKARTYTRVEDANGNLILENRQLSHEALSARANWYMLYMLRYACTPGNEGTGYAASIENVPVAGKTGTSSNNWDRWFCGFTPRYTAAVWCGYDIPEELHMVAGGNPSVRLWKTVMSKLLEGMKPEEIGDFEQKTGERFYQVYICSRTGLLAGSKCVGKPVSLFASDIPAKTCNAHFDFKIQACYPNGKDGAFYCATTDCILYQKIVSGSEFQKLAEQHPELKEYAANTVEDKTLYLTTQYENYEPTLQDALQWYGITDCPVHSHERLLELQSAVLRALTGVGSSTDGDSDSDGGETPKPGEQ